MSLLTANVIFLSLISISSFVFNSLSQGVLLKTFISHTLIFISSCSPSRHFQDPLFKADPCSKLILYSLPNLEFILFSSPHSKGIVLTYDLPLTYYFPVANPGAPCVLVYLTLSLPNLHFVMFPNLLFFFFF